MYRGIHREMPLFLPSVLAGSALAHTIAGVFLLPAAVFA